MKTFRLSLFLILSTTTSFAFQSQKLTKRATFLALTPEEQRAEALSQYLSRAHEEKLRAIQELEMKKAEEIKSLMKQLEALRTEPSVVPPPPPPPTSQDPEKEQMKKEIEQLRKDLSTFKKQAEEDKARALKEVEAKMKEMYGAAKVSSESKVVTEQLFEARNAKVAQAAAAGKSRWGDKENQKAASSSDIIPATVNGAAAVAIAEETAIEVPAEVAAADKGLRKEGAVGGMSLAERIAKGANAGQIAVQHAKETGKAMPAKVAPTDEAVTTVTAPMPSAGSLYEMRNAMVAAAGAAGKSRWGSLEISKAAGKEVQVVNVPTPATSTSTPAKASSSKLPEPIKEPTSGRNHLYSARNARVVAAGQAGKSRWGDLEVKKSLLTH